MLTDRLIEETIQKKNPCIVGIDPEWEKIPDLYKQTAALAPDVVFQWAADVIDCIADLVPAVKPQMAFYEVYGADGIRIFQDIVAYAHEKNLIVIDDSKRNDIGNTARAYAYAPLSEDGPVNADFLTVSPFPGTDSLAPFFDAARQNGKGVFVLVKTSNPGSADISDALHPSGIRLCEWLADHLNRIGQTYAGRSGYSPIGAVVGATFPKEAADLRKRMPRNYFLVPGYGAQGGTAEDIVPCFNEDGLGALVSSSRGILYPHLSAGVSPRTRTQYQENVRQQARKMQREVYQALKRAYQGMAY